MPKQVKVTGLFKDPADRPLAGFVYIEPLPEFVLAPEVDTTYAGKIRAELDEAGNLETSIIATEGWAYKVTFDLLTQDGLKVCLNPRYVEIDADSPLPDLIGITRTEGVTRPRFTFDTYQEGELRAYGATLAPDDDGAIIVPAQI